MSDYAGYIPVPVWDGKTWQPTRPAFPIAVWKWPEGFDPSTIAPPKHNIGDWVNFQWGDGIRRGEIRAIHKSGGAYMPYELRDGGEATICRERYEKEPHYNIYWNGHGRYCEERNIIQPTAA